MVTKRNIYLFFGLLACAYIFVYSYANAQEVTNAPIAGGIFDIAPSASADIMESNAALDSDMTHPVLYLTPDKSELVRLDQDAASVIVGNPNHLSVMLDTPNTLVVVPRAQGASYFTVMGKDGSILMQRHAIVGGNQQDNYVRIRRSCGANSGNDCQETSVYFCPDVCHEVSLDQQASTSRRR